MNPLNALWDWKMRPGQLLRSALLAALATWPSWAGANPTGGGIVRGTATIVQSGSLLQITNSPNAIINWNSFSIAAGETTRFVQPSASSAVLNRVVGQDPSSILGSLQSNGRVFLINPNGIVFGAGAVIDVAGLVASSLHLSDTDFLAGRLRFNEIPGAGAVVNQGAISTAAGGNVYLVAPNVTNSGIITTPNGEVILAAGSRAELVNPGTPNLRVEITAADNEAVNLGQIIARSGRIGIYAGLIRSGGVLNADRAVGGSDGEIHLKATKSVTLDGGGSTSASGGNIVVEAGDSITLSDHSVNTLEFPGMIDFLPGTICPASSQGCGHPLPPQVIVVVGGGQLPQPGGNATEIPPVNSPDTLAVIRAIDLGNAQVVGSIQTISEINSVLQPGSGDPLSFPGPQSNLVVE